MKAKQRGMTLIEVMVALAIFGYAAVTLVTASSANLNSHFRLKEKTVASWVADNQLAEYIANYQPGQKASAGKLSGKSEMAGQTYYYKIKVEDSGNQWLNQVLVSVSSDPDGKYQISSVTGFIEKS